MKRSHTCGALTSEHVGQAVTLCGWVDTVRDHGGILFIDLRDRYGMTQVVCDPDDSAAAAEVAKSTRPEFVIQVKGTVRARPADMVNARIATGGIELVGESVTILNTSKTPPFPLDEDKAAKVHEELRMESRYLDLRRASVQRGLILRHKMAIAVRKFMDEQEFIEVETPILTKSTPEGARDYLVPNRVTPGTFYALPQAPQQYKQLLMVGGMDRYFQLARCFRDEDLRADRQPEFTQIDVEMSFVDEEDLYGIIDGLLAEVMVASGHPRPELPLPRMSWHEAMDRFGSDKPDLRFGWELTSLADVFAETEFKVFANVLKSGGVIKAINCKGQAGIPIRMIDEWTVLAKSHGMGGLAYIRVQEDGTWKSPIVKFFAEAEVEALRAKLSVEPGDLVLFAAEQAKNVDPFLGKLRLEAANHAGIIPKGEFKFTWVTEFPLFEETDAGRLVSMHHPFTTPKPEDVPLLDTDPGKVRAVAYDIVLNGVELGSGSIRIHDPALQGKMFDLLKVSEEEKESRFGHLLKALAYGAPPHGGIALGFDRLALLMAGGKTIRDVIAFPKNHKGIDLMMDAPSTVDAKQLHDVHIQLDLPPEVE
ncbi:MAG: aspartate--tRNA ligase [Verrucomicrobia bacterium]|nr:aspartate--tRNA ligase [Verrucomicrobiota bacterium]MCH8528961.1 aspartate--tRNA ligase [Kiritimatiellia bacterium]